MKYEQTFEGACKNARMQQSVKELYKIAGMLEMMTCMQDRPLTPGMIAELVDAVDKLELIGADLMNEADYHFIEIYDPHKHERLVDLLGKHTLEKDVSAHEAAEESPPEGQPADQ